jgi:L-aminopeptidase/D-esterase-like protein
VSPVERLPGGVEEVAGVAVAHWSDPVGQTGCTVVVLPPGTIGSGEVRGGAPATREFALLAPERRVEQLDAVVLSGGSAFGLAACDGVVAALEDAGRGFATPAARVPIVVGCSLYDLGVGDPRARPGAREGRAAASRCLGSMPAERASERECPTDATSPAARGAGSGGSPSVERRSRFGTAVPLGSLLGGRDTTGRARSGPLGGGTGATVRKWPGAQPRRGGLGSAALRSGELVVAALVAVNALGDRYDPFHPPLDLTAPGGAAGSSRSATTIGVVVTNAALGKLGLALVAQSGHDGLARALDPVHTLADGDALVALATGGAGALDAGQATGGDDSGTRPRGVEADQAMRDRRRVLLEQVRWLAARAVAAAVAEALGPPPAPPVVSGETAVGS